MNAAGRLWVRGIIRSRWRSVVALGVMVALVFGVAGAAATGARRSATAVDRSFHARLQPDVMSIPARPGFDWSEIVALPYIESYGLFATSKMCLRETGGLEEPSALCTQPPVAGGWYDTIWRLDVLDGRLPSAPDEIAINRLAQRRASLNVGDRLTLDTVGPGLLEGYWNFNAAPDQWGPSFEVTITGVFAGEDAWRLISGGVGGPGFVLGNEFMAEHGDEVDYRTDAFLRFTGGEHDVARFRHDLVRITGDDSIPVRNVHEAKARVERATALEANAQWLFAAALVLVGMVLVSQGELRLVRAAAAEAPTQRALGMSPRQLVLAMAAPGLVVGAVGAAGAFIVYLIASRYFPIGLARTFEPRRGVSVDWAVVGVGFIAIYIAERLVALSGAWRVLVDLRQPATSRPGWLPRVLARVGLPIHADLGVRLALERRPGGQTVPVQPAVAGAIVAVGAVVAAFTFSAGLDETRSRPERAGQVWDAVLLADLDEDVLATDPDVAGAMLIGRSTLTIDGTPMPAFAGIPVSAERTLDLVVLDGRLPETDTEVAIGPATGSALGVGVGDHVLAGSVAPVQLAVVGTMLVPEEGGHSAYDEGVWLSEAAFESLTPDVSWAHYFVAIQPGADRAELARRLTSAGAIEEPSRFADPVGLVNLERTRDLPLLLGGLFVVIGIGTVGHTVFTTLRRRRHDLGVLRALGLSRRETRIVTVWQATTLGAAGVIVGVPLGVMVGRTLWEWVATSMPLVYVAPFAALATVVVIPVTLAVLNAVAYWPARATASTPPAAILRTE